jgi:hypothetical protein
VFSYIYLDNLSPSKLAGYRARRRKEQGELDYLWITFLLKFSSMISTLKRRNPGKATFFVIFCGYLTRSVDNQRRLHSKPYKRLSGLSALKVFGRASRSVVGLLNAWHFASND